METCPACNGTGKCRYCHGTRKNNDGTTCQVCSGTGRCQEKTPAGYICDGVGKVTAIRKTEDD